MSRTLVNNKNAFLKTIDEQWIRCHHRARDLWSNRVPDQFDVDILSNVGDDGHRGDQPVQVPWGDL
jgi:hypothetical protein